MVFETRKQSMAWMDINKKIRTFDGRKKWRLEFWARYELWAKERNSRHEVPCRRSCIMHVRACCAQVPPQSGTVTIGTTQSFSNFSSCSSLVTCDKWTRGSVIQDKRANTCKTNKQTNKQKQISTSVSSMPFIAIFIAQEKLDGRRFNSLSTHSALWADSPVFECGFCCCCCCCCCCCFVWNSIVFSTFACFWGIEKKTSFDRTIFHV